MCGIIGAILQNPSWEDIEVVQRVFRESRIRGMHATGISVLKDDKILTLKEPVPAHEFTAIEDLHLHLNEDGNLYMIGHCRYSTSDIEYNQPFSNSAKTLALAHNGVITQEMPDKWYDLYGYVAETKNDSELLLHTVSAGKDPFSEWPDASISAVELRSDKTLRFYRNGKRPLHLTSMKNGFIITSTFDVVERAEVPYEDTTPVMPGVYCTIDNSLAMMFENDKVNIHDLQPKNTDYRQSLFS